MYTLLLLVTLGIAFAAATSPDRPWSLKRPAKAQSRIKLHIGLSSEGALHTVEQTALNIADPSHALFRHHLSSGELQKAFEPPQEHAAEVLRWLREGGVTTAENRGQVVEAPMTVAQAEALLNTTYSVYTDGVREIIRTEAYHVPKHVRSVISFVTPTTQFPPPFKAHPIFEIPDTRLLSSRATCGSGDDTTPSCIRQAYGITYTAQPNRTTFAVYATEAASYSASDTSKFLQDHNSPAAAANAGFEVIGAGDSAEGSPGIEGAFETHLDTQTSLGLAWPAHGILYNLGGVFGPDAGQTYDPFVQFLQGLIHNDTVPSVVSFSESMPENQVDPDYARSLCSLMAQVGARGVTLLFSSGDNGPQGDQPTGSHDAVFEPEFPASCPFVTSVGGTTNMANETAATQATISGLISKLSYTASGGGLSNLFERPSYQDDAVSPYISQHIPESYHNKSGFNASGRGIPDVSAFSTNFPVVWEGLTIAIGGTSASTPLWAAVITLLNDYEASKGRPPLGFVNPWLYSLGEGALKDITTGGDNGGACYLITGCTLTETPGYNVTAGWDPVTGLGSPIFSALTAALDEQTARR